MSEQKKESHLSWKNNEKSHSRKFMFLQLGTEKYALPLSHVREVLGLGPISTLPNMPPYFAGLINLRGKIVSAVDLRKSLSFIEGVVSHSQGIKKPCVIITEFDQRMFGAIIDDIIDVHSIEESSIDYSIQKLSHREMFEGTIKLEGMGLAPILNLEKALRISELLDVGLRNAV